MDKKEFRKIEENFNYSLYMYNEKFRSNHWKFQISRKNSLFKKKIFGILEIIIFQLD